MSPVIDFSQVKGPELLPDGEYLAKIVFAEEGLSTNQNPKIEIRWEIIAPEEHTGRLVFDNLTFTADSSWRVKQTLVALGFDETFSGEVTADMLMDKEAAIVVNVQKSDKTDSDGNAYPDRNRVRKVRPAHKYNKANAPLNEVKAMDITPANQPKAGKQRGLFNRS